MLADALQPTEPGPLLEAGPVPLWVKAVKVIHEGESVVAVQVQS
jgi:hypothetical protein